MTHSKIVPFAQFKNQRLTILEVANLIVGFYRNLSKFDSHFNIISVLSEKAPLYNSIEVRNDEAVDVLAKEILNQNIENIVELDREENPNIDFLLGRAVISIGLEAKDGDETYSALSYRFTMSGFLSSALGSIITNKKCFESFEKSNLFLETVNKSFDVEYSVLKISDRELNSKVRKYKAPLGWITYFSNDYELKIPEDLKGVEYKLSEKGVYLILTKELFADNLNFLELKKQELLKIMNCITEKVPEYLK